MEDVLWQTVAADVRKPVISAWFATMFFSCWKRGENLLFARGKRGEALILSGGKRGEALFLSGGKRGEAVIFSGGKGGEDSPVETGVNTKPFPQLGLGLVVYGCWFGVEPGSESRARRAGS